MNKMSCNVSVSERVIMVSDSLKELIKGKKTRTYSALPEISKLPTGERIWGVAPYSKNEAECAFFSFILSPRSCLDNGSGFDDCARACGATMAHEYRGVSGGRVRCVRIGRTACDHDIASDGTSDGRAGR